MSSQTATLTDRYFDAVTRLGLADARWWRRYMALLYDGVPLAGATVLDVGGGDGRSGYYAAAQGAASVTCLEPADAGSNPTMDRVFTELGGDTGLTVDLRRETFQDFDSDDRFDVIVLNNSINHLDEDACVHFRDDPAAGERYRVIFEKFARHTRPGGHLLIADAGTRNLWGDIGVRNPFAPSIEWAKHLQPSTWAGLADAAGFDRVSTGWNMPRRLGRGGEVLLGHAVGGYFVNSHFVLHLRRRSG